MEKPETYHLTVTIDRSQTDITKVMDHIKMNAEIVTINLMKPLAGKELKAKATEEAWSNSMDSANPVVNYAAGYKEGYFTALKS